MLRVCLLLLAVSLLAACGGGARMTHDPGGGYRELALQAPDAVPRVEPLSRYGNQPSYTVNGERYEVMASAAGYAERGLASWYGAEFHERRTSNGEVFDMYTMTAAHKRLPLPTYVEVTNLDNGRKAVVRVNDRGPFHSDRIIDLSYAAAARLGMVEAGTARVEVRALELMADASPVAAATSRYVQVGAFGEQRNAETLRARLARELAQPVRVHRGQGTLNHLFLVQVGPLPTADTVPQSLARLAQLGITTPQIVFD